MPTGSGGAAGREIPGRMEMPSRAEGALGGDWDLLFEARQVFFSSPGLAASFSFATLRSCVSLVPRFLPAETFSGF